MALFIGSVLCCCGVSCMIWEIQTKNKQNEPGSAVFESSRTVHDVDGNNRIRDEPRVHVAAGAVHVGREDSADRLCVMRGERPKRKKKKKASRSASLPVRPRVNHASAGHGENDPFSCLLPPPHRCHSRDVADRYVYRYS